MRRGSARSRRRHYWLHHRSRPCKESSSAGEFFAARSSSSSHCKPGVDAATVSTLVNIWFHALHCFRGVAAVGLVPRCMPAWRRGKVVRRYTLGRFRVGLGLTRWENEAQGWRRASNRWSRIKRLGWLLTHTTLRLESTPPNHRWATKINSRRVRLAGRGSLI